MRAMLNQELPSIYVKKWQNGRWNSQKALQMNRLGSLFGTNIIIAGLWYAWYIAKLLHGVFDPIFTPNAYLNTVFNDVVSLCGSCRNNALPRSPWEMLQLVAADKTKLPFAREKKTSGTQGSEKSFHTRKEYATCRSPHPIDSYSLR